MIKKIIFALALSVALIVCFVSCSDNIQDGMTSDTSDSAAVETSDTEAWKEDVSETNGDGITESGGDVESTENNGMTDNTESSGATNTDKIVVEVVITATDASVGEGDENFDLKSMFSITANGQPVEITDSMINKGEYAGSTALAGKYNIVITYTSSDGVVHSKTAVLTVTEVYVGPF